MQLCPAKVSILLFGLIAACGSGAESPLGPEAAPDGGDASRTPTNDSAPPDAGAIEARPPSDAGADAVPESNGPYGIETRPSNQSCFPPMAEPPQGNAGLPATLSATGCFDPDDVARPAPGLIPYDVNAPLWSDGADKTRWFALPDGAQIEIGPDGDFVLPPGALAIKTFSLAGRPVETRFLVRLQDGHWFGYTYAWNEAGTDAVLLDEGQHQRTFGQSVWTYPSRAECMNCHTPEAGFSLGLETMQLDRTFTYPGAAKAAQLATLAHIGLFASPLPAPGERPPALPDPADEGMELEGRARAYLHANCANCHRGAAGTGSGNTDFRFTTLLANSMTCNAEPRADTLGVGLEARVILPGDPAKSMVVVRMRELGRGRMPEVGTVVVDEAGVALVSDWIRALPACP